MVGLQDKVVLITGAAGALGRATARAFAEAGARLVLVDRGFDDLDQAYHEWPDAIMLEADLTSEDDVKAVVAESVVRAGSVDVLINVAGGFRMGPRIHETSLDAWEFMLDLNARSVFLMSREVIRQMLQQGGGKIVSVSARPGLTGGARMAPYAVSKSAVIRLTESIAAEYKHDGINANCILPSIIDTPRNRQEMPDADFDKWVTPEAIARVIRFLASEDARPINGAAIPVYGRS